MKKIHNFFKFIANRGLSGIVNGLFYAGSKLVWPILILLIAYTGFHLISDLKVNWCDLTKFQRILSIVGIAGTLLSLVLIGVSFKFPKFKLSEIHLWTFASQTGVSGTMFISKKKPFKMIWWQLLAVAPSAFLQKLFINVCSGSNPFFSGTDDASGKTWGMTVFGKRIKVPRLGNMKIKMGIAIFCIIAFVLISIVKNKKSEIPLPTKPKIEYV